MGLPAFALLIIAKVVSNIGIPSAKIGTTTAKVAADLIAASIEITDKAKPRNSEPVSPINIFAGLKLNGKKPIAPPASATRRIVDVISFDIYAIKERVMADIAEIPAASPSSPSIKLTVFVIPTIQNTVSGRAKIPK